MQIETIGIMTKYLFALLKTD